MAIGTVDGLLLVGLFWVLLKSVPIFLGSMGILGRKCVLSDLR